MVHDSKILAVEMGLLYYDLGVLVCRTDRSAYIRGGYIGSECEAERDVAGDVDAAVLFSVPATLTEPLPKFSPPAFLGRVQVVVLREYLVPQLPEGVRQQQRDHGRDGDRRVPQ